MSKKLNSQNTRKIVTTAILAALIVVLQLAAGFKIGIIPITLTLIPIVVGAILLGPAYSTILVLVFGFVTIILVYAGWDNASLPLFTLRPVAAWLICLLKGAAAGFCPAVVYKFFNEKKYAPQFLVALSGAFIAAAGFMAGKMSKNAGTLKNLLIVAAVAIGAAFYLLLVRYALKKENSSFYLAAMISPIANTGVYVLGMMIFFRDLLSESAGGKNVFLFLLAAIAINFIVEFAVSVILAPAVASAVKKTGKKEHTPDKPKK